MKRALIFLLLAACTTTTGVHDTHQVATTQLSDAGKTDQQVGSTYHDVDGAEVTIDADGTVRVLTRRDLATSQPSRTVTVHRQTSDASSDDVGHVGASASGWLPDSVQMEGFASKTLGTEWKTKVPVAAALLVIGALVFYCGDRLEGGALFACGIAVACLPTWMIGLGVGAAILVFAWPYLKNNSLFVSLTAGTERAKTAVMTELGPEAQRAKDIINSAMEKEQTPAQKLVVNKVRRTARVQVAKDAA